MVARLGEWREWRIFGILEARPACHTDGLDVC